MKKLLFLGFLSSTVLCQTSFAGCITPQFNLTVGKGHSLTKAVSSFERKHSSKVDVSSVKIKSICEEKGKQSLKIDYEFANEDGLYSCEGEAKVTSFNAYTISSVCEL